MRQVAIDNIEPGMVTARHVYPPGEAGGIPLLAQNVVISEAILKRLRKSGIGLVVIDDEFSMGIETHPPITDDTRQSAIGVLKDAFQGLRGSDQRLSHEQLQDVERVIGKILVEVAARKNLLVCLSDLNLFGGDGMQRSLDVCVVGTAVAKQFFQVHGWKDFRGQRREDGVEDRMVKLGVGLLLQDIGMMAVPDAIREKHGILTAEERNIVQQHPLLGLDLMDGGETSPLTKVTIAQHHERYDGSGYPRGLSGDELHDHGQIAAVAEAYVSLCDQQSGEGKAFYPHQAYQIILQARGRLFRPEVVDAFALAVAPYGPGATVQLSDGRYGIVVGNTPGKPLEPVVRVTHDQHGMQFDPTIEVDLSKAKGKLKIEQQTGGLPSDRNVGPQYD